MKILAAEIATITLNKMGFLAIREGSLIKMQHAYVIVDDVCSGLRSLISPISSLIGAPSRVATWHGSFTMGPPTATIRFMGYVPSLKNSTNRSKLDS